MLNTNKLVLLLAVLCCSIALSKAQNCLLASCAGSDCPNGCTGCSGATQVQLSEGKTSLLCPKSGSFCFRGSLVNGVCTIQNCDACSSSDPSSCSGCKSVTANNSNSNHCDNNQCYSMSYTSVSIAPAPPLPSAATTSTAAASKPSNTCILSSCNSVNCPNGCGNCAAATMITIPNNGTPVGVCPNSASFCFTGSKNNNKCTISNCDGCSSGDPASCTNCQAITSNTANKDWCLNGNCYHMTYSSVPISNSPPDSSVGSSSGTSSSTSTSTSSSTSSSGSSTSGPGVSANGQALNCELLQCTSGDCPNGCKGCSKATSVAISDGNIAKLCPSNGSFCFKAAAANGVCMISSCISCGSDPSTCMGCELIAAQNSVSNFCSNTQCYHMGYTATLGGSVGASSSNSSNGSNDSSTTANSTGNSGIGSTNNGNGNLNFSGITNSGLSIRVSLLLSVLVGGLVVLF